MSCLAKQKLSQFAIFKANLFNGGVSLSLNMNLKQSSYLCRREIWRIMNCSAAGAGRHPRLVVPFAPMGGGIRPGEIRYKQFT